MSKQDIIDYVMDTPHNINPAILNQKLGEMEVQPDWNQSDPKAPNYVKNRPFYTEGKEVVLINGDFKSFSETSNDFIETNIEITFVEGESYTLYVNGESRGTVIYTDGNHVIFGSGYDSWQVISNGGIGHFAGSGTYTIKFVQGVETVHKLDAKYLPTPDLVITISHALSSKVNASDVDITGGSVEAVCEKLLSGVPVDIRVRGFEKAGSYAAYADEVTAKGFYYAGKLHVSWLVIYGSQIRISRIFFNMDGTISSILNEKVATTEY